MSVTLIAYPLNDSNTEVPYVLDTMGGTDIAVTYSIGDIEDVTKQRGSFSKTITLPNTPTNRACFAYAYNIQSFVGGFQPNKRIRAAMWEDGVQVFSGVLQLLSMSKTKGTVTYEVGLFTDNVSLFKAIEGNMLVNTAGVTGMNHTPTSGHVSGTWTASGALSSGYVYGVVDAAGFTDILNQGGGWFQAPWWRLGPSIYVKKMVDLIFTEAGFRYSSTFFNSSLFNKLVIPYAAGTMPINLSGSNILAQSTGNVNFMEDANTTILFSKDTPAPFYDNPGYWVASSSTFVAPAVPTRWNVDVTLTVSGNFAVGAGFTCNMSIRNITDSTDNAVITNINARTQQQFIVRFQNVTIPANTTANIGFVITQDISVLQTQFSILSGATVQWTCLENPQSIGVLDMRTALPADVKQSDLLQDLQKMFNLYFYQSPLDPKLIYIEPFTSFYNTTRLDWSQKSDENAEMTVLMGDPSSKKRYVFKYADGGDALGKLYQSEFKEGYGSRIYDSGNYNRSGDQVVDLKAKTLIPAQYTTNLIAGRGFDTEGNGNPRSLQLGYRLALHSGYVQPNNTGLNPTFLFYYGQVYNNSVPSSVINVASAISLATHLENPYDTSASGNFDLSFGIPRRIFYRTYDVSGNPMSYNNNNLFNNFWNGYIFELTSQQAMTVECTMLLTSTDIATLDFRKLIYWKGINWRLLEIKDYAVGQSTLCRVTMRRVLPIDAFVPTTLDPTFSDDPTAKTDGEINASIYAPVTMLDLNEGQTVAIPLLPDNPTS